ncbi:MAG: plasmid pRiA4b ORF-3 family protein [Lachnospiraceae bacterium]|nr:plasmid pRiA4b ORF-3 family protein [Lachnospiraceae bacterium]
MNAYQLKITLKEVKPAVWRRVIVPEGISFSQLTMVIHEVMGWSGYHLSEYLFNNLRIILREEDDFSDFGMGFFGYQELNASNFLIDEMFDEVKSFTYTYDFGDDWRHQIQIEKVIEDYEYTFPMVVKYKGEIPPEDCGGPWGYEHLLEVLEDPKNEEYEDLKKWYDLQKAEDFDLKRVNDELSKMKKTTRKIKPISEQELYKNYFDGKLRFDQVVPPEDRYEEEEDYYGGIDEFALDEEFDLHNFLMENDDILNRLLDDISIPIMVSVYAKFVVSLREKTDFSDEKIKEILEVNDEIWESILQVIKKFK